MANDPTERERGELASEQPSQHDGDEPTQGDSSSFDSPTDTPFDHPLFLPAILAGLWVWFGYDGFIEQDPEMLEHLSFNRGGFAILSVAMAWFGYKGWKEMSERGKDPEDPSSGP